MQVTDVRVYPVKSLGGLPVERAVVEAQGLAGDRRWGLVDPAGDMVTAREVHALLRITAEVVDEETIRLTDRADGESILVDTPLGLGPVPIGLSRLPFASPADTDVSEWLSAHVGADVRLVWQEEPTSRTISGAHGGEPGDHVSMADTSPILVTSEASLAQLDAWVAQDSDLPDLPDLSADDLSDVAAPPSREGLSMLRFRPNVVVDGDEPFAEDRWTSVRIGAVDFRVTELCDRCVMTTLDPVSLEGGKEPIRTLARHHRWDGKTWFGVRLTPLLAPDGSIASGSGLTVGVGDEVVARSR